MQRVGETEDYLSFGDPTDDFFPTGHQRPHHHWVRHHAEEKQSRWLQTNMSFIFLEHFRLFELNLNTKWKKNKQCMMGFLTKWQHINCRPTGLFHRAERHLLNPIMMCCKFCSQSTFHHRFPQGVLTLKNQWITVNDSNKRWQSITPY